MMMAPRSILRPSGKADFQSMLSRLVNHPATDAIRCDMKIIGDAKRGAAGVASECNGNTDKLSCANQTGSRSHDL